MERRCAENFCARGSRATAVVRFAWQSDQEWRASHQGEIDRFRHDRGAPRRYRARTEIGAIVYRGLIWLAFVDLRRAWLRSLVIALAIALADRNHFLCGAD